MRKSVPTVAAIAVLPALFAPAPRAAAVPLAEQTPVKVKLLQPLKSGHERKGERVRFAVAEDIKDAQHAVIIPKGSPVVGTITRSSGRRMFGKPGRLEFTIDYIKVSQQVRVPLRSTVATVRGQNNAAPVIGAAVLLTPVALLVKGKEVTLKPGQEFTVFVNQTTEIPTAVPATAAATTHATEIPSPPHTAVTAMTSQLDKSRLSLIQLKNGDVITGTLIGFKDGIYTIATELGEMRISQNKVATITEKQ